MKTREQKNMKSQEHKITETRKWGLPRSTFTGGTVLPQTGSVSKPSRGRFNGGIGKSGAGFTMIELLVTVGIFTLVTSVLLANYPKFSSKILLENTAHSVGLSIRQAQTFGLNVRGIRVGASDTFPTYGAHFSLQGINETDQADTRRYVLFADVLPNINTPTSNDKIYEAASDCTVTGGECAELFTIQGTERIYLLCGNLKSTGATFENWQSVTGADCSLSALDIAYTRPNPDAVIKGNSAVGGPQTLFTDGEIVVRSARGEYKTVVVWSTGQIAVE